MISSYPNAIAHVDADSFFASCEQAIHPELKGKPVVTGLERGIAASMSYEAKAKGVTRAMPYHEIQKICPDVVFMPSDYETYSLFSKRMFAIMRRYSSIVEEYGIDEGFIDLTGLRRPMNMSYQKMVRCIKDDIKKELDIVVSVGLAPTKVLAKIASNYDKPDGCVFIPGRQVMNFLKDIKTQAIWGVGHNTSNHLFKLGIYTAKDLAEKSQEFVEAHLTKPHQDIWHELNGEKVYAVSPEEKTTYASISKTKTFTPPSTDASFVWSQLVKNVEGACIKARRYSLVGKRVYIFLKKQNFEKVGIEIHLNRATAYPNDLLEVLRPAFDSIFQENTVYRSTGFVISEFTGEDTIQGSLFEDPLELVHMQQVYDAVDALATKFGKHTVHLGASFAAHKKAQHAAQRGTLAVRKMKLMKGENLRQRLRIPFLLRA